MNTPTPRTDAAASESIVKVHETSQQLERELTAALAEIDRLDVAGIHSCHANCQKSMCVMRRELTAVTKQRDELKNKLEKSKSYKNVMKRDNAELRKQRDRLADLVKQFIYILDITEESDGGRLFHPTNITSCRAGDLQKIGELVEELRRASLHQPTEP